MNKAIQPAFSRKLVGSDLLGLLTLGMYTDPLVVYREYLQNAADSINASGERTGRVDILIDPIGMGVTIRDDGPGLSHQQATRQLVCIADSDKRRGVDRGFRGIGRLSGLAFAESVSFLTRQCRDAPVVRIQWDGSRLRTSLAEKRSIEDTVHDCVTVNTVQDESESYPDHFFQVEIKGVARFAAGVLLNRTAVWNYIGEVCPVPFAPEFQFGETISAFLNEMPLELEVYLNDEDTPVTRPHGPGISFSETSGDCFGEIEQIMVPSLQGDSNAAVGWIAHSSYLGALPKNAGIRGIRARDGNMQVGGESLFDHLFTESRFNRWCVGEINILDPCITLTGQRDYFEPGPHTRNLENHLKVIFRMLERRCRQASSIRNTVRRIRVVLEDIDAIGAMVESGYLTKAATRLATDKKLREVDRLRMGAEPSTRKELDKAESRLIELQQGDCLSNPIPGIKKSEVAIYQTVFSRLVDVCGSPRIARETIDEVLAHGSDSFR